MYKEKYFKYKKKYLDLKGGIINKIEPHRLLDIRKKMSIPDKLESYIKMITIPKTKIIRVGSSINKIQPYFSDVDIMNIIDKPIEEDELIKEYIIELKKIVFNIINSNQVFFSDFKAGGLHWTSDEIMNEEKSDLKLMDALKIKDVVKIDMIAPYNNRYVEMSTFFVLKSKQGYINIHDDYFTHFEESLLKDIHEFKKTKPFKAIKRLWSYSRLKNDIITMDKLKDLIRSNIALLSQINADIETIVILVDKKTNYNKELVIIELDEFKEKISSILDIEFNEEMIDLYINLLISQFKSNVDSDNIIENLNRLHNYILNIINKETNLYLKTINYEFPN
jgi:hypothetical protein